MGGEVRSDRCSVGDDTLWGVKRHRKSTANSLAALKSIRAVRPDGAPIYWTTSPMKDPKVTS